MPRRWKQSELLLLYIFASVLWGAEPANARRDRPACLGQGCAEEALHQGQRAPERTRHRVACYSCGRVRCRPFFLPCLALSLLPSRATPIYSSTRPSSPWLVIATVHLAATLPSPPSPPLSSPRTPRLLLRAACLTRSTASSASQQTEPLLSSPLPVLLVVSSFACRGSPSSCFASGRYRRHCCTRRPPAEPQRCRVPVVPPLPTHPHTHTHTQVHAPIPTVLFPPCTSATGVSNGAEPAHDRAPDGVRRVRGRQGRRALPR